MLKAPQCLDFIGKPIYSLLKVVFAHYSQRKTAFTTHFTSVMWLVKQDSQRERLFGSGRAPVVCSSTITCL